MRRRVHNVLYGHRESSERIKEINARKRRRACRNKDRERRFRFAATMLPTFDGQTIHDIDEVPPRFGTFGEPGGPHFGWTTERWDGVFVSFSYVPEGADRSQPGCEMECRLSVTSIRFHRLRKNAKAEAAQAFRSHQGANRDAQRRR